MEEVGGADPGARGDASEGAPRPIATDNDRSDAVSAPLHAPSRQPRIDATSGVVVCGECEEPLELHCKHGHDPLPIGVKAPRATKAGTRFVYDDKVCACGTTFTPTGPNAKKCPRCRGLA